MAKFAIITATCGPRDKIRTPSIIHSNADYIAFSDTIVQKHPWNVMPLPIFTNNTDNSNARNAKLPKILPEVLLPGYDYYIWTDANHDYIVDPIDFVDTILKENDIALFAHPERDTIKQEADLVARLGLTNPELVKTFMEFLGTTNYNDNKLFCGGSIFKRASHKTLTMSLSWWELICKYGSRDQLALPFVIDKHDIKVGIIPGSCIRGIQENSYFPDRGLHGTT